MIIFIFRLLFSINCLVQETLKNDSDKFWEAKAMSSNVFVWPTVKSPKEKKQILKLEPSGV